MVASPDATTQVEPAEDVAAIITEIQTVCPFVSYPMLYAMTLAERNVVYKEASIDSETVGVVEAAMMKDEALNVVRRMEHQADIDATLSAAEKLKLVGVKADGTSPPPFGGAAAANQHNDPYSSLTSNNIAAIPDSNTKRRGSSESSTGAQGDENYETYPPRHTYQGLGADDEPSTAYDDMYDDLTGYNERPSTALTPYYGTTGGKTGGAGDTSASIQPPLPKVAQQYSGIYNQGNTCYLNALLQALYHLPAFRSLIYAIEMPPDTDPATSIPFALQMLFATLQRRSKARSTALTAAFGWSAQEASIQHDAHELTVKLFDALSEIMKGTSSEDAIKNLFCGERVYYTKCLDVEYTSRRAEEFYDVELVVKDNPSITDSLAAEVKPERLEKDNRYCWEHDDEPNDPETGKVRKTYHEADRGTTFRKLPPVLMIHPVRVDFCRTTFRRITVNDEWSFTKVVDFADYVAKDAENAAEHEAAQAAQECLYELRSVVVHSGGAMAGHYYCYVYFAEEQAWVKFDDDTVTDVSEATVFQDAFSQERSYTNAYGYTTNYGATKRASQLVYTRQSEAGRLLGDITESDIPPHVAAVAAEYEAKVAAAKQERDRLSAIPSVPVIFMDKEGAYLDRMRDLKNVPTERFEATKKLRECDPRMANARLWSINQWFTHSSYFRTASYHASALNPDQQVDYKWPVYTYASSAPVLLVEPLPTSDDADEGSDADSVVSAPAWSVPAHAKLLSVSLFDGETIQYAGTAGNVEELEDRYGITPSTPVVYEVEKHLKRCYNLGALVSGDIIIAITPAAIAAFEAEVRANPEPVKTFRKAESSPDETGDDEEFLPRAQAGLSETEVEDQSRDRAVRACMAHFNRLNNSVEVEFYRMQDGTYDLAGKLELVDNMTFDEVQEQIAIHFDDGSIGGGDNRLGLRAHSASADAPHKRLAKRLAYSSTLTNEVQRTLRELMTEGQYMICKLYFEMLPIPVDVLERDGYRDIPVQCGAVKRSILFPVGSKYTMYSDDAVKLRDLVVEQGFVDCPERVAVLAQDYYGKVSEAFMWLPAEDGVARADVMCPYTTSRWIAVESVFVTILPPVPAKPGSAPAIAEKAEEAAADAEGADVEGGMPPERQNTTEPTPGDDEADAPVAEKTQDEDASVATEAAVAKVDTDTDKDAPLEDAPNADGATAEKTVTDGAKPVEAKEAEAKEAEEKKAEEPERWVMLTLMHSTHSTGDHDFFGFATVIYVSSCDTGATLRQRVLQHVGTDQDDTKGWKLHMRTGYSAASAKPLTAETKMAELLPEKSTGYAYYGCLILERPHPSAARYEKATAKAASRFAEPELKIHRPMSTTPSQQDISPPAASPVTEDATYRV